MKGLGRSKALVERGGIGENHRSKKLVKDKREYESKQVGSGAHPDTLAVADDLRGLDKGIRHIEESLVWKRWTDPRHIEHGNSLPRPQFFAHLISVFFLILVLMRANFDHSFVINSSVQGKKEFACLFYMVST